MLIFFFETNYMNDNLSKWWSTWAPFWDLIENRHFSTEVTDFIINDLKSPVLVIGAGQGLIVRHLTEKGFTVTGLDINEQMIGIAKKKYGLDIITGDARDLPFENKSFNTVIISSGVVDYGADEDTIKIMVKEAKRVLSDGGNLYAAFYQLTPKIEKIYREIGVIDREGVYRMKRIFEIDRISRVNPFHCLIPIKRWTKKSVIKIIIYWTKLGLNFPVELKNERNKFKNIVNLGKPLGITKEALLDSVPECIPYRTKEEIESLINRLEFKFEQIEKFDDCVVVQIL
jgi:ubiquinone/menaquinone biosynthesis C-methylase UbiE